LRFSLVFTALAVAAGGAQKIGAPPQNDNHGKTMKRLSVLLATNGHAPYEETAGADTLATVNAAVLGQLIRVTDSFELEPSLLKSWKFDFSNSTYVLTLQDGVTFHNGRKATSADLEFSLLRGFFSKHRTFYSIFLDNIDGIDEITPTTVFKSGIIKGVKIIDANRVSVRLRAPNPAFLFSLVNPYFSLVPKEEIGNDYISWKDRPIGAGPYKARSPFKDGHLSLALVDSAAHPTSPKLVDLFTIEEPSIEYGVSLVPLSNKTDAYYEVNSKYPVSVWSVFFSNANPLGSNEHFRKAVFSAIDRSKVAQLNSTSTPAFELLPKHFWGRANLQDPFSTAKSREHLKNIPKELLKETWEVPVFSSGPFSKERSARLKVLGDQLKEIGVLVHFYPSSEKFISEATARKSPMKLSGRVTDVIDPLLMFASLRANSPYKYERPSEDPKLEQLFSKASFAQGTKERTSTIHALSAYVSDKAYLAPIVEDRTEVFVNRNVVSDIGRQNQPMTLFLDRITLR
jgi:ABC-type transport system substrate-binding protein